MEGLLLTEAINTIKFSDCSLDALQRVFRGYRGFVRLNCSYLKNNPHNMHGFIFMLLMGLAKDMIISKPFSQCTKSLHFCELCEHLVVNLPKDNTI